jgi:hypothetical protein
MPSSGREAVLDNSNADKFFDDEFAQEDLHLTAEELRDLWRAVRERRAGIRPKDASAADEGAGSAPEEGALLPEESAATKATRPPPPPPPSWMLRQGMAPGDSSVQSVEALPPLSSPVPPVSEAERPPRPFTASLHPEEAPLRLSAASPASRPAQPFSRQPFITAPTQAMPENISSGVLPPERFDWVSFRHHSRWFLPAVLVLLFFVLVALVSLNEGTQLPQQAIGPMFFIFAAIGILQSGALYYADANASDTAWVFAVAGGIIAFLSATSFALFPAAFAFLGTILLLALGGLLLRRYSLMVRAGTAAVMGRFGKPRRTLYAGFHLRFPGEKVLGTVETGQKRCELPMTPIHLHSGEQVKLRVAALYEVIPGEEHLAVRNTTDWHLPIQQRLATVVEDVVSSLTAADLLPPSGESQVGASPSRVEEEEERNSPLEVLNDQLTTALREQVADRGVVVLAVKAHMMDSPRVPGGARAAPLTAPIAHPPLSPHPTFPLPADHPGTGRVVEGSGQALPHYVMPAPLITHVAGMVAPSARGSLSNSPEEFSSLFSGPGTGERMSLIPPSGMSVRNSSMNQAAPLLSLQQLEQLYNNIVERQIIDGSTIRRIIAQFDAVAADEELSEQANFDAAGAARNLRQYLASLERRTSASQSFPPDSSSPPPQLH